MESQTLLHLVYIHGFQGNDTTFQSFPADLQKHVAPLMPKNLSLRSSLYPTYKSVKPISFATRNFLDWLTTQPEGFVIVIGHSMGGLLAADAATDPSNVSHRIIGMIAFDTPYLGMHPHVVVSGIASLFAKKDEDKEGKPSEKDLNGHHVEMVDNGVTDDWQAYKKNMQKPEGYKSSASLAYRAPSPELKAQTSSSHTQGLDINQMVDRTLSHPFVTGGLKFLSAHTDDPLLLWARKHSDAPIAAGKTWIIEHFQFGSCMFDVTGLKERYARLVGWDGYWVNYWTETVAKKDPKHLMEASISEDHDSKSKNLEEQRVADNDTALIELGMADPEVSSNSGSVDAPDALSQASPEQAVKSEAELKAAIKIERKAAEKSNKARLKEEKATEKALKKQREEEKKAEKKGIIPPHHFVVLPTGLGRAMGGSEKWEQVQIAGVDDEVAAHCGLFIRGQNIDYDGLVDRVGQRVLKWCKTI